jgi:hypothetical protein
MLDNKNLIQLGKLVARANASAPTSYSWNGESVSYNDMHETLRQEFAEIAGTPALYRENKNLVFSIMEEIIDDILPKRVAEAYDQFAEVKTFKQGEKVLFRRKLNTRARAKQFITRVGLAGRYEVFKLGNATESFEVPTSAVGGAAQVGFEEFLDGRVDFAELIDIVMEGIDELIYREIGEALKSGLNQLPAANRVIVNDFDEAAFDKLLLIASGYGDPTIYCTYEFAVKLVPQEAWRYTEAMKDELNRTGMLANYKGRRVIVLPQSFTDETHSEKVVDPSYCWIIPTGTNGKPVKVAFEGPAHIKETDNDDWSKDFQVYKKVGVVAMMTNNICVYKDESLSADGNAWNLNDTAYDLVYTSQASFIAENPKADTPADDKE